MFTSTKNKDPRCTILQNVLCWPRKSKVERVKKGNKNMNKLNGLDWVALVLVIIGGLNWGLVGLLEFNLVDSILGEMSTLSRIVYVLVGLSAVYTAVMSIKLSKS